MVIVAMHGAASEALRDRALRCLAVAFDCLGGAWALEPCTSKGKGGGGGGGGVAYGSGGSVAGEAVAATERGSTACVFLGVASTEIRLVLDEAIALHAPSGGEGGGEGGGELGGEGGGDAAKRPRGVMGAAAIEARTARVAAMAPVCLGVVERFIQFLCSDDDDDGGDDDDVDDDDAAGGGAESGGSWSSLSSGPMLALLQALNDVAGTLIEFLRDAQRLAAAAQECAAAQTAAPPGSVVTARCLSPALRTLSVRCARCLGCWLAQESESLRTELKDAKVLPFLLALSAFHPNAQPRTAPQPRPAAAAAAPGPLPPPAQAMANGGVESDGFGSDGEVDSDDELADTAPIPMLPPLRGHRGTPGVAPIDALVDGLGDAPLGDDVFFTLLPALAALGGGDSGALELADCGAHRIACRLVALELPNAAQRSGPGSGVFNGGGGGGVALGSLVWAMGLLGDLLLGSATAAVVCDGFSGRLVDDPCFRETLPGKRGPRRGHHYPLSAENHRHGLTEGGAAEALSTHFFARGCYEAWGSPFPEIIFPFLCVSLLWTLRFKRWCRLGSAGKMTAGRVWSTTRTIPKATFCALHGTTRSRSSFSSSTTQRPRCGNPCLNAILVDFFDESVLV